MRLNHKVILFVITILLIIVFTPIFGGIYEAILGPASAGFFWGFANPEYVPGFLMSYIFFITLLLTVFKTKNKYKSISIALLPVLLLDAVSGDLEIFIVDIAVAIIAFALAHLILVIYKQLKVKK